MKQFNPEKIIKEIPLFSKLSGKQIAYLRAKSRLVDYRKGQIIYKQDSALSCFYCVVMGRVAVYVRDSQGNDSVLEYLHRGRYFGIISLLTGENHSVTAKAINDCLILEVREKDFNALLRKIPSLAIDLSRTLSRRLKRKDLHKKTIFESTVISVFSSYPQAGKTIYASNLAFGLRKETHKSVVIIDICRKGVAHTLVRRLNVGSNYKVFDLSCARVEPGQVNSYIFRDKAGIDMLFCNYTEKGRSYERAFLGVLSLLVNDYHYIILDLPSYMSKSVFNILNQSDIIHLLTSPRIKDVKRTRSLIDKMRKRYLFSPSKIKAIVNAYKLSRLKPQEEAELLGSDIYAVLPKIEPKEAGTLFLNKPSCDYAKAIRRIARQEGDCLVGLALGIGVAYGFCHIGVLKVIEEEKIPIDVITGSSMGALIASLWATGKSAQEIMEITKEFRGPKNIWNILDFTIPFLGFIKGNKLYSFLKRHLGNKSFYDLQIPLKIIASDIKRKEPRILDKGLLVDAIMASCCMPGVFRPFKFKEEVLFDGGVINPLPTEPLFELGVKKIIAVNVTPSREDIIKQYAMIKEIMLGSKGIDRKRLFDLKRFLTAKFRMNILDIIFSSVELLQSAVAQKEAQIADVVLHPDISGLHWLELHKAEEFVKRGEEEARKKLGAIKELINQ